MALPVTVVLDRTPYGTGPLDLSPLVAENSLIWSSVVPGGFASCSFQLMGDPRQLVKQVPYLSILRVVGDSGRVLFEGQIEDLASSIGRDSASLKVGAYGLQNELSEFGLRNVFSKRDMDWGACTTPAGTVIPGSGTTVNPNFTTQFGQFDATDLTLSGVQVGANGGVSIPNNQGAFGDWKPPVGLTALTWLGTYELSGPDSGTTRWLAEWWYLQSGSWTNASSTAAVGPASFSVSISSPFTFSCLRVGVANASGAAQTLAASDLAQFYDMRILGVISTEDTAGGFYGDTLITQILSLMSANNATIGPGVIESGSDFLIDHLDASTRRTCLSLINEVAQYYTREWAIWEDGLLHWTSPNLSRHEWIVPISEVGDLDLDASVVNSKRQVVVRYLDAASGLDSESVAVSSDRRNPYVLNERLKHEYVDPSFPMTTNTSARFAAKVLQEVGYGPVPASGTVRINGEKIIQHAQGNAAKAWEIRAGDNVTIPELPLADVFTQDGRGECLFHVVSVEANASSGEVTLSLDSYGSKRSDVLLARLAAVTQALGG